ncbi:MAG: VOC family protein [Bacteroidota bacterium]
MPRHHSLDYVEFTVRDLAEAKQFYAAAFGWRFTDYGPRYAGIQGETREVGGIEQTDFLRPSGGGALAILYSDDLEATQEAVEAAGGTIEKAIFSFPGGRRFHFLDPSGNELAVWTETDATTDPEA